MTGLVCGGLIILKHWYVGKQEVKPSGSNQKIKLNK